MDEQERQKTLRTLIDLAGSPSSTDCWDESRAEDLLRSQSNPEELRELGVDEKTIEHLFGGIHARPSRLHAAVPSETGSVAMKKLPDHTALKEWSLVVDALGRGEQVILLRKGGIADASFAVEATRFYLYPTYFHQGETEPRPEVAITHWCEVVRSWSVRDPEMLRQLESLVALPQTALEARYRFRPDQALRVMGVKTWALARPSTVVFREAYAGCRSWLSVDEEIDIEGSQPVLPEAELASRLDAIENLLAVRV